jgi:hypothetical protein
LANRPYITRAIGERQPTGEGAMLYIVELVIDAGNLALELGEMRTWLDHMKFQAIGFRQIPGTDICRVHFENEQQARAFAKAFTGRLLTPSAA